MAKRVKAIPATLNPFDSSPISMVMVMSGTAMALALFLNRARL